MDQLCFKKDWSIWYFQIEAEYTNIGKSDLARFSHLQPLSHFAPLSSHLRTMQQFHSFPGGRRHCVLCEGHECEVFFEEDRSRASDDQHPFLPCRTSTNICLDIEKKSRPGIDGDLNLDFESVTWTNAGGYGSIPINTIFSGMNIHLPAILMWTTGVQAFDTLPGDNMTNPWLTGWYQLLIYSRQEFLGHLGWQLPGDACWLVRGPSLNPDGYWWELLLTKWWDHILIWGWVKTLVPSEPQNSW